MNVLLVTYGLPFPPQSGAQIRDLNTIRCLSRRHSVMLLSVTFAPPDPTHLDALREYCEHVDAVPNLRSAPRLAAAFARGLLGGRPIAAYPYYFEELARKIRHISLTRHVDVVSFEQTYVASYLDSLPRDHGCRTVLSLHNIASSQYRSMAALRGSAAAKAVWRVKGWLMDRLEDRYLDKPDYIVAVSERDASVLRAGHPRRRVSVVENGFDAAGTRPLPEPRGGNNLVFVGTMLYPPNTDAVIYFAEEVLPIVCRTVPDAAFVVVGMSPPEQLRRSARPNVVLTGSVADVVPYYEQALVAVVPLRAGGGTRLKILEAMALGRAVVTTSKGCEGLDVCHGEHVMIADSAADFARCVVELLQRPDLRQELARNARRLVETRYDWSIINEKLSAFYDNELSKVRP